MCVFKSFIRNVDFKTGAILDNIQDVGTFEPFAKTFPKTK